MFETIILGHLVGDYFLQNDWMALSKGKYNGLGWFTCFVHCILYTFAMCFITWNFDYSWVALVFFSHFIPDKFGLSEKYLQLIRGRSIVYFFRSPENYVYTPYIGLRCGFTSFVYIVVDNTMHLLLLYYGWKLLY